MIRKLSVFFFILFFAVLTAKADSLDRIIAVVNSDVITQNQLAQQMVIARQQDPTTASLPDDQLKQKVLQHMIDVSLQQQIATKAGIKVTDDDVDQAIGRVAQGNGLSVDDLKSKVTQQGVSYDTYRNEIRTEIMLARIQQKVIAPTIGISEQQTTDAVAKLKNNPQQSAPNAYHIIDTVIVLPDSPTAQQVSTALQQAQTLKAKLLTANAQQAIDQSGAQINDMGWQPANELPDLFVPYVQKMKVGDLAGPIKSSNGFHIIKLVQIQDGMNNNFAQQSPVLTHVEHILIKQSNFESDAQIKSRLNQLRASIMSGKSFADVASANSQDPVSAVKGGDLGWVKQGMLDPAFEAEMNKLQPGQISEPVKSQFGWHIIEVLGRKNETDNKDLLRDQARLYVYQKKFQEGVQDWLQDLRARSYIKIMDN